eukprot:CAMPEP_0180530902 /NCGR_PEP_ID=MMETSP1036_2-20121128/62195_1 /TAXON_ID=632150 /ORGANISM="Azadinium spinosum, Strain 3D9" /LENGTH=78 /DNA_ID=CAMNT_0022544791 /DNA_START=34 /DNA_END=272 /DNA_ORIENTATION=-
MEHRQAQGLHWTSALKLQVEAQSVQVAFNTALSSPTEPRFMAAAKIAAANEGESAAALTAAVAKEKDDASHAIATSEG